MHCLALLMSCALILQIHVASAEELHCDAGGPYHGAPELPIRFDGTGSASGGATISSYEWEFGDGDTGDGALIDHAYSLEGFYTVTLTTTEESGASHVCHTTAEVFGGCPTPLCDAGGPYSGSAGSSIMFDGTGSSMPGGTIVSYEWSFGDGEWAQGVSTQHIYQTSGIYTVTLVVTADQAETSVCTTTADVTPVATDQGTWGQVKRLFRASVPWLRRLGL